MSLQSAAMLFGDLLYNVRQSKDKVSVDSSSDMCNVNHKMFSSTICSLCEKTQNGQITDIIPTGDECQTFENYPIIMVFL